MSKAKSSKAKAPKGLTQTQLFSEVASRCGLTKTQVACVYSSQEAIIHIELKAGRPVTIPGIAKLTVRMKPALPARMVRNPSTGLQKMAGPKPAHKVVKARVVKRLKDVV